MSGPVYLTEEARHKYGEFIKQVEGKSFHCRVIPFKLDFTKTTQLDFQFNLIGMYIIFGAKESLFLCFLFVLIFTFNLNGMNGKFSLEDVA